MPIPRRVRAAGRLALLVSLLALGAVTTRAQLQITLTESNVIGGSPVFFNSQYDTGAYTARNIFDQQSGAVDMSSVGQPNFAWFPYEGISTANRFVTIDLGAAYVLSGIEIFNSNQVDRGASSFTLSASNSVTTGAFESGISLGSEVSAPTMLVSPTALAFSADTNPITGQSFAISNPSAYRYLQLILVGPHATGGVVAPGLAEVRLYSAVPEPSSYAALVGLAALGLVVWRRRHT